MKPNFSKLLIYMVKQKSVGAHHAGIWIKLCIPRTIFHELKYAFLARECHYVFQCVVPVLQMVFQVLWRFNLILFVYSISSKKDERFAKNHKPSLPCAQWRL